MKEYIPIYLVISFFLTGKLTFRLDTKLKQYCVCQFTSEAGKTDGSKSVLDNILKFTEEH